MVLVLVALPPVAVLVGLAVWALVWVWSPPVRVLPPELEVTTGAKVVSLLELPPWAC